MKDKIGIGLVGVGFMGSQHAKVISELPEARLVAVQDTNEERAKAVASTYKADYCKDYRELLKRKDIDAVVIATPDHLHKEPSIAAAEAGKHVLLEKPIATSVEDGKEIISAFKKANLKLMIGHILRFDTRYYGIKLAVKEGNIGKPVMLYGRRNATIAEARRLKGRIPVALYLAIHDIDLILWYTESKAVSVYAEKVDSTVKKELGVPDFTWILFRLKTGALGSVECGWAVTENWANWKTPKGWGGFGDVKMEVIGTSGSIHLDYYPMCLYACDKEGWKFPDTVHWPTLYGETVGDLRDEDRHFIKCVREDSEPLVKGEDGLSALEVVLASIKSYETGKPVEM